MVANHKASPRPSRGDRIRFRADTVATHNSITAVRIANWPNVRNERNGSGRLKSSGEIGEASLAKAVILKITTADTTYPMVALRSTTPFCPVGYGFRSGTYSSQLSVASLIELQPASDIWLNRIEAGMSSANLNA